MSVQISLSDPEAVLELWERGIDQPAWRRDDLLLAAADGNEAPRALGQRNARLMALHGRLFGARLDLHSICPHCATPLEFSADSAALARELATGSPPDQPQVLEVDGHRIEFRVPDSAAVAQALEWGDAEGFEAHLLHRCVLTSTKDGVVLTPDQWPARVRDALSAHMDALDPGASVSFDLECLTCAARWDAHLDTGQAVWRKLQAAAERLLLDVDALARTYGWTQREVLALSPIRRAAYLQMVSS